MEEHRVSSTPTAPAQSVVGTFPVSGLELPRPAGGPRKVRNRRRGDKQFRLPLLLSGSVCAITEDGGSGSPGRVIPKVNWWF